MSTTNPAEFNVEVLLEHTANESRPGAASSHREDAGGREHFVEEIRAAISDLDWQITAGALDPAAALNLVAARTLTLVSASGAAIGLVIGPEVVCCATAGTAPDIGARIKVDDGLSGECVRSGKVVRSDDAAQDSRVEKAVCQALSMGSAMAVPIHFAGNIIGVFEVFSAEPNAFGDGAELAMSQLAHFMAGVANACMGQSRMEAVPKLPEPTLLDESSGAVESTPRTRFPHRWRAAVLVMAALVTAVFAVSYRVRDMLRSSRRAHPVAEISPPALQPPAGPPAVPVLPLSSEPAIAREDGQVAPSPDTLKPAAGWHRARASAFGLSAAPTKTSSAPPPQAPQQASAPPRKLEVTPEAPALTAVQPATQRDAMIGPLLNVPVADPKLSAAQTAPLAEAPRAGKPHFVSRVLGKPKKLKVLVEKSSNNEKNPPNKTSSGKPQETPPPSTESP